MKRIKQTTIRDDDGRVWTLARPARHGDILRHMRENGKKGSFLTGQGFVTDDDAFVGRREAAIITLGRQVTKLISPPNLYSEDLW